MKIRVGRVKMEKLGFVGRIRVREVGGKVKVED